MSGHSALRLRKVLAIKPLDNAPSTTLIEPLTRRELEILALLAQGLSGPEIAEKLTLALNSVRWHIQRVYGKLGVNRKHQALDRAQALSLLSPSTSAAAGPGHNLPLQLSRFFGREAELGQLSDRLDENRLVTLTGSGGVGKTRLALRVAEDALGEFADGVWFIELAPLTDPALVPRQVAAVLGLSDDPRRPSLELLTAHLHQRQALLVLDNCEHLATACAQLAEALLRACPALKILASSRQPLGADGEAVFRVPSLPFPAVDQPLTPERLSEFASARLLVDRARLVVPDYRLAAHNAAAISRICRQLDGIPLALELAAARLKFLSAEQIAARLDDALGLLTTGRPSALPRHRTLQATIDWSFGLLTEPERSLLLRLTVFAGGWTLEAVEAIGADDGREAGPAVSPSEVVDRLTALVDKSLVIAERRQNEPTRYRLLETVRQFAREKLLETGTSERLSQRHAEYFVALAENIFDKPLTDEADGRLLAETENLRLALEWSFSEHGNYSDLDTIPRLLANLLDFMAAWRKMDHQEVLDWCNRAVVWCQSHAGISSPVYARMLGVHARALTYFDLPGGVAALMEVVEFIRHLGPESAKLLMEHLSHLGSLLASLEELEQAQAAYAEAETVLHELGPGSFSSSDYLAHRGAFEDSKARLANKRGRHADAKMYAAESIRLQEENGHPEETAGGHLEFGEACLRLGEYDQARHHFLEALNAFSGNILGNSYAKRCLGLVEFGQGNLDRALAYCQASVRDAIRASDINFTASALGLAAMISAKLSQPARAAKLSGASQALYASTGRKPWENSSLETLLTGWRERPDQAVILQAWEVGRAMNYQQAVAHALAEI